MAAGATYEPIATTTISIPAISITFSSIPATYTDLRVVFVGTSTLATGLRAQFNGDTATNYSRTSLLGDGSSVYAQRGTNIAFISLGINDNLSTTIPTLRTMDIFSYAGSTYKTVLTNESTDTNGGGAATVAVQLWRSTSAITSISLNLSTSTIAAGSIATLYGIKNA
jgi:hypothetical protein